MNVLDLLIVLALFVSVLGGYRRGFWLGLAQYAGALAGILIGARFAPDVVDRFGIVDPAGRQAVAIIVIVVASAIGGTVGFWLVGPIRRRLLNTPVLGALDSLAGAVLSAAVTLIVAWLLALTFARGPVPEVSRAIQQSTIIRQVDESIPASPAFIDRVQRVLSGTLLPPIFTGLEPELPSPVSPSNTSITDGVRAAAASTVRIEGLGCGGIATGSGFAVGNGLIVTNAHVVSGTAGTRVSAPDGQSAAATVVYFDPGRDLAILRAPDLRLTPLVAGEARTGTEGAVIGYPGGGPSASPPPSSRAGSTPAAATSTAAASSNATSGPSAPRSAPATPAAPSSTNRAASSAPYSPPLSPTPARPTPSPPTRSSPASAKPPPTPKRSTRGSSPACGSEWG